MGFAGPHFLTKTAVMIPAMLRPIGSLREALFSVTFFGEATGRQDQLSFISPAVLGPEAPVAEGLSAQHLSKDPADGDHRLGDGLGRNLHLVHQRAAADVFPVNGDQTPVACSSNWLPS